MSIYSKILVAIDGSLTSLHALEEFFKLAQNEGNRITVVSVIPPYIGDLALVAVGDIIAAIKKPWEEALKKAQELADKHKVLIKTVCEEGEPYERIIDLAQAENCDLIVMGRRGLKRLERVLLGSVTARVIGYSPIDVLVVTKDTFVGWQRILLATDGSKYSEPATRRAIDLASSYGGEIKVISVVDVPPEFYAESPKTVDELITKTKGYVEAVKRNAEGVGVSTESFVREGESYKVIADMAEQLKVNIIVMGSHGRTGLERLLMGSVTEKVIGHTDRAVLVVKSGF
ncbi:MAG: universal stress protein [bacterium]